MLSSANAFNLDQSKILSFGKELTYFPRFDFNSSPNTKILGLLQIESLCRRQNSKVDVPKKLQFVWDD